MDEKAKDRIKILSYIKSVETPSVSVADIAQHSGAERFRVFPILYELYLNDVLVPESYTFWDVPAGYFVRKLNT